VDNWSFLSNYGRTLLCITRDPEVRLRDIALSLGISERSACSIVTGLTEDGYLVKTKAGRRSHYQIQSQMPLPELPGQDAAVGPLLELLADSENRAWPTQRCTGDLQPSLNSPKSGGVSIE
jgi:hypothetical protein